MRTFLRNLILLFLSCFIFTSNSFAGQKLETHFEDIADWNHFDHFMQEQEQRDREIGWSYVLSGVLVGAGSAIGAQATDDIAGKLIYGISSSLGIWAISYGSLRLLNGNEYSNFYESLRRTALTPTQRDELVKNYIEREREKEERIRITKIVSHLLIGGMNFYSAAHETDKNTKSFFQFLGGVNLAVALAYSF